MNQCISLVHTDVAMHCTTDGIWATVNLCIEQFVLFKDAWSQ